MAQSETRNFSRKEERLTTDNDTSMPRTWLVAIFMHLTSRRYRVIIITQQNNFSKHNNANIGLPLFSSSNLCKSDLIHLLKNSTIKFYIHTRAHTHTHKEYDIIESCFLFMNISDFLFNIFDKFSIFHIPFLSLCEFLIDKN